MNILTNQWNFHEIKIPGKKPDDVHDNGKKTRETAFESQWNCQKTVESHTVIGQKYICKSKSNKTSDLKMIFHAGFAINNHKIQ